MGVFLIIAGLLAVIIFGILIGRELKAAYRSGDHVLSKKNLQMLIAFTAGAAIAGGVILNLGIVFAGNWNMDAGHYIMTLLGGTFFFAAVAAFIIAFHLRYYRTDLEEGQKKNNRLAFYISIPAMIVGFLLAGEGMAPYFQYPLVQGFAINEQGFTWLNPLVHVSGGLQIHWYGVLIVGGAILAYKISDHEFYKKYGRHGILDTCFLICFPCGILGARIWYVIGNWNGDLTTGISFAERFARGEWWSLFAVWEGGLTILGGAVGGILGGMVYMLTCRKYVDIRFPFDVVVPTILLAQAIGRFGNFFNREVYGLATEMSAWPLLPTWIKNNMAVSFVDGAVSGTQMYVPLFLIEGLFNVAGFFVIAKLIPLLWKKKPMGVNVGFYLIWYGIVRIIMEPMRDPTYNMGTNGQWSIWNSMIYIILGVVVTGFMIGVAVYRAKKGLTVEYTDDPKYREKYLTPKEEETEAPVEQAEKAAPAPEPVKPTDFSAPRKIGAKKEVTPQKPAENENIEEGENNGNV